MMFCDKFAYFALASWFGVVTPAMAQPDAGRQPEVATLHIDAVRPVEASGIDTLRMELEDGNRRFPKGTLIWHGDVQELRAEKHTPRHLVVQLPVTIQLVGQDRLIGLPLDRLTFDGVKIASELIGKGPQKIRLKKEQRALDVATGQPVTWSWTLEVNYEVTAVSGRVGRLVIRGVRPIKPASDDDRLNFYLDRLGFLSVSINDWERRRPNEVLGGPWGEMGRMFDGSATMQVAIVPSSRSARIQALGTVLECNPIRVSTAEIGTGPRTVIVRYRKGSEQVEYEIEYEVLPFAKSP
ncbi:MAG: hypothetical protein N2039_01785 [Gemmataceae bacterium]|nr:hypothetical protein [Gemmataceae bacterium]